MPDTIKTGTILIKEGTVVPETVRFESEPCVPGWRLVMDLDGCGLDRKIREAGWTFFGMAGMRDRARSDVASGNVLRQREMIATD